MSPEVGLPCSPVASIPLTYASTPSPPSHETRLVRPVLQNPHPVPALTALGWAAQTFACSKQNNQQHIAARGWAWAGQHHHPNTARPGTQEVGTNCVACRGAAALRGYLAIVNRRMALVPLDLPIALPTDLPLAPLGLPMAYCPAHEPAPGAPGPAHGPRTCPWRPCRPGPAPGAPGPAHGPRTCHWRPWAYQAHGPALVPLGLPWHRDQPVSMSSDECARVAWPECSK